MPTFEQRGGLRGRRAMVVGGGFGIGAAVTQALADCGVELAVCDIDAESLPDTVAAAERAGVSVFSRCFDALDVVQLEAFYRDAGARLGHLDIVVNVVGGTLLRLFDTTTPDDWAHEIHRNFGYVLHSTKAALPLLRKSGRGGSIINFTTIEAHRGAASLAVYAGAKAGLTNYSRALAVELGPERIRINTLASDLTPTRGNLNAVPLDKVATIAKMPASIFEKAYAIATPLVVPPTVEEIANGVLFLASDLSSGVTGSTLHLDGGTFAASGFNNWPFGDGFSPVPFHESLRRLFPEDVTEGA
jgi:NAD(P)-dependent dehydrogenase (short-subunit alcohol dehydrogenase family)